MGNNDSQSVRSVFEDQFWVDLPGTRPKLLKHRLSNQIFEKHYISLSSEQQLTEFNILSAMRTKLSQNCVSVKEYKILGRGLCENYISIIGYVEQIRRLDELSQTSLHETMNYLVQAFQGYDSIYHFFGDLDIFVSQKMIGLSKQNKIKVWHSENFAELPSVQQNKDRAASQHQLCIQLFKLFQQLLQKSKWPIDFMKMLAESIKIQGKLTVKKSKQIIQNYLAQDHRKSVLYSKTAFSNSKLYQGSGTPITQRTISFRYPVTNYQSSGTPKSLNDSNYPLVSLANSAKVNNNILFLQNKIHSTPQRLLIKPLEPRVKKAQGPFHEQFRPVLMQNKDEQKQSNLNSKLLINLNPQSFQHSNQFKIIPSTPDVKMKQSYNFKISTINTTPKSIPLDASLSLDELNSSFKRYPPTQLKCLTPIRNKQSKTNQKAIKLQKSHPPRIDLGSQKIKLKPLGFKQINSSAQKITNSPAKTTSQANQQIYYYQEALVNQTIQSQQALKQPLLLNKQFEEKLCQIPLFNQTRCGQFQNYENHQIKSKMQPFQTCQASPPLTPRVKNQHRSLLELSIQYKNHPIILQEDEEQEGDRIFSMPEIPGIKIVYKGSSQQKTSKVFHSTSSSKGVAKQQRVNQILKKVRKSQSNQSSKIPNFIWKSKVK